MTALIRWLGSPPPRALEAAVGVEFTEETRSITAFNVADA